MAKKPPITKPSVIKSETCERTCMHHGAHGAGMVYGLGFIGAAIYYVQNATGFWMGVLGILKAVVWPAMLVYKLLGL